MCINLSTLVVGRYYYRLVLWVHFNTMRWCDKTILHLVWMCAFVYGNVYL